MKSLVILPACEAAFEIVPTVWRIRRAKPNAAVLVVDAGSTDGTSDLAIAVGRTLGDVFVLRQPSAVSAFGAGVEWARERGYEVVAYRDNLDRAA